MYYDQDALIEAISDNIYDDPEYCLNIRKGHLSRHLCDKNEAYVEDIKRIIEEGKIAGSGSFFDKEIALDSISDAVYYDVENIANWAMKTKGEFLDDSQYWTYETTVELTKKGKSETYIGSGVTRDFDVVESRAIRIVLERDNSNESECGFYLKTAYPDNDRRYSKILFHLEKSAIIEQGLYVFDDKYKEAAFLNSNEDVRCYVRKRDDGYNVLHINYIDEQREKSYKIFINERNKTVKAFENKLVSNYDERNKPIHINVSDVPDKMYEVTNKCCKDLGIAQLHSLDDRMKMAKIKSNKSKKNISTYRHVDYR